MRSTPSLHYRLRSRQPGSFGTSRAGRVFEFVTLSWFRFEIALLWLGMAIALISAPWNNMSMMLIVMLFSPAVAFMLWFLMKSVGIVFYFLPGMNWVWGYGRIIFLTIFSRLVAQEAPEIEMPAWFSGR